MCAVSIIGEACSLMKQTTFSSLAWNGKKKTTRREGFLAEMDRVIPWDLFIKRIEPVFPKAGAGRHPHPLERMLRIHFMQIWFNLSDPQAEDSLYDIESMRRFARIELESDAIPDESTILRFRHLLEEHHLAEQLFADVRSSLEQRHLLLKAGTIVDATIIAAPPSTKNADKARDPEMRQTRKGKQWHFGMKAHIGCDKRGIVHSLATTDAAQADISQMHKLLHGQESEVYGDQAYWSQWHRAAALAKGIRYRINRRGSYTKPLTDHQRYINQVRSRCRARGEHAFNVVKRLWGYAKVRYRGLAKNTARLHTAFALANLYLLRRRLAPA